MRSEFLIVAGQILQQEQRPMSAKEITEVAIRDRLFSDKLAGKTPHQTMKSKLSVHIRRNGAASVFVRTDPGKFQLRQSLLGGQGVYEAKPHTKPNPRENVLVFPSKWLEEKTRLEGISRSWKKTYASLLKPECCRYMDRLVAESDSLHKQILTYIMVTRNGAVLSYKRGTYTRIENFLRGSYCVGFGGHVNSDDLNLFSTVDMGVSASAARELGEELKLPDPDKRRLESGIGLNVVGVLNDDSSAVGQRHFAFLFRYEVSDEPYWDNPERGEKSVTQLRWLHPDSSPIDVWHFEYWSQLCLRQFFAPLIRSAPAYRIKRLGPLQAAHILCVLGPIRSGKSVATRVLCQEFGYTEINSGQIVAELLNVPSVPETPREDFQREALKFITNPKGPERLAKAISDQIRSSGKQRFLVDGIRHRSTIEKLRECTQENAIGLLYVHTPPDLAFNFYKDRERPDSTVFDFLKVRNAQVEEETESMINICDAVLYNWAGLPAYEKAVRELFGRLAS